LVEVVGAVPEAGLTVDDVGLTVVVVVVEPSMVVWVEPGTVVGTVRMAGTEVVEVVVGAFGPSGEVQPVGGTPLPVWPGMRIVPAQPKFEKLASKVTEPPSAKLSVALTWRMNPAASIDTTAVLVV
jgi:hypothetical protein